MRPKPTYKYESDETRDRFLATLEAIGYVIEPVTNMKDCNYIVNIEPSPHKNHMIVNQIPAGGSSPIIDLEEEWDKAVSYARHIHRPGKTRDLVGGKWVGIISSHSHFIIKTEMGIISSHSHFIIKTEIRRTGITGWGKVIDEDKRMKHELWFRVEDYLEQGFLPSKEQVKDLLTEEATKLGYLTNPYGCLSGYTCKGVCREIEEEFVYDYNRDILFLNSNIVYNNGAWAPFTNNKYL